MLKSAVYKRSPKVIVKSISGHSLEKFVEFNETIAIVVKNVENKATIYSYVGDNCSMLVTEGFVTNILCKSRSIVNKAYFANEVGSPLGKNFFLFAYDSCDMIGISYHMNVRSFCK